MLAIFKIFRIIKEVRLYREYVGTIKKEKDESPFWRRRNLRLDNLNRIYTVVNLPAQVLMSTDLPREARPSYVIQEVKPINEYLKSLNLHELLTMWIKPVEGTNDESYLIVYQFLFRNISWIWILRIILEITVTIVCILNWNYIASFFN